MSGEDPALEETALAALATPEAHPGDRSASAGVAWRQTHISHVFLTAERVYKFRKPVDLGFVRFGTRARRNRDCLDEVRLNRRLAPDVYLGVAPLCRKAGGVRVGEIRETLARDSAEHCVVMRRLPDGRDGLSLLERGALRDAHLDAVAERIAAFHETNRLGEPAPFSREQWLRACTRPVEDNFALLAEADAEIVRPDALETLRERSRAFVRDHAGRFEARRRAGRAVDGHGDLHLQHLWFEHDEAPPLVIDCVEFDPDLRRIDAASDVAFTAMDLVYRGETLRAERFLRIYADARDDFDLYGVVDYFQGYRAAVRAKVASVAARDADIEAAQRERAAESTRRHLELARSVLADRGRGTLVLVGGVVGTGKSTVARALADRCGAVVASSDRLRKRLFGLAPHARAGAGFREGIYTSEATRRVYAGLCERARAPLASGRVVVLDATFARRDLRQRARAVAVELGAPAFFVETRCAPDVALARLTERAAVGRDASDAGPEQHRRSAESFEPPDEWPPEHRVAVHTDAPDWRDRIEALAARLRR